MSGNALLQSSSHNSDGAWLCSVVPGCSGVATLQANVEDLPECNDCGPVAHEAMTKRDALLAEAVSHAQIVADIAAIARGGERLVTDDEAARYVLALNSASAAQAEANRLSRDIGYHSGPHTHPRFACSKHEHMIGGK